MTFYIPYVVGLSMISYIGNSFYNSSPKNEFLLDEEPIIVCNEDNTIHNNNIDRPYLITKIKPNSTGLVLCNNCKTLLPKTRFSKSQLKKKINYRCKVCCKLC